MKGFFSSSLVQSERPDAGLIPRCGSCGLYKQCQSPKMVPFGEGLKGVLVVGEAPGELEDERGRPFIGKAGRFLRQELARISVKLDRDAVTTNALICRPPGNKIKDPRAIAYCHANLLTAIRENSPRVVLTLGRSALASALQGYWKGEVGSLERWVGWKIPLGDFWLCPTYHPSYLLRSHSVLLDRVFAEHLDQAFSIKNVSPATEDLSKQIECLMDEKQIVDALREIEAMGGWASVDYETNCLKPEYPKARIVSCAVSNGRRTISYPWWGQAIPATREFLHNKWTRKIASNLKFEDRWTRFFLKRRVRNWGWDTMLAAHCLDNRQNICSLKFQTFVHLGIHTYNENIEPYLSNNKNSLYNRIHEIALETLLLYGGMDALLEYRLAMFQRQQMGYEDKEKST